MRMNVTFVSLVRVSFLVQRLLYLIEVCQTVAGSLLALEVFVSLSFSMGPSVLMLACALYIKLL